MARASVFTVEMSFGTAHQIHDAQSDYGFLNLPVVIEIIDQAEQTEGLFAELGELLSLTLVDIEPVRVIPVSS